eukprot:6491039-Amphidinium_carterae.1
MALECTVLAVNACMFAHGTSVHTAWDQKLLLSTFTLYTLLLFVLCYPPCVFAPIGSSSSRSQGASHKLVLTLSPSLAR